MKQEASHVNVERGIVKQFRREIWRPFVKGLRDYEMIRDGDKAAVCISGGKDPMLLARCLQQLKWQSRTDFGLELIITDPGYNSDDRNLIEDSAAPMNILVRVFDSGIFDIAVDVEQSPCCLCAKMRREYLYARTRELGCNKIALGHHFDDVIGTTLMGILYGGQVNTITPRLHSTNFRDMELIRPLYYAKEEDILGWKDYSDLHFLQYACRFTERIAKEQAIRGMAGRTADIMHTSKRQRMKELIRFLRKTNPFIDASIMKSVKNINLNAYLGYVKDGARRHSMDECNGRQKKNINHLLSTQIFLKDYERWQMFFMELIKKRVHMNQWRGNVTTQIILDDDSIVPDTPNDMEQVILDTGEIQIEAVKNQEDKVAVKGKLEFQVPYRKESGGLQTLGGNIPFERVISVQDLEGKDYMKLSQTLEDLNTDTINSRRLGAQTITTFRVRVETLGNAETAVDVGTENNSHPAGADMSDMDGAGQVQVRTLRHMANAVAIAVRRKGTYRVKEELSLTGGESGTGQLLWWEMKLRDVTTKPLDGRPHLDGEPGVFVVYGAEDENIPIRWLEETVPFSGDMEVGDAREDQIPMVTVYLAHRDMEAKPDYDGEIQETDMDIVLGLGIKFYEEEEVELLSGIYSSNRGVELNRSNACFDQILTRNVCKSKMAEELSLPQAEWILQICHSEGTIKLDEMEIEDDCPEIGDVLGVTFLHLASNDTSPVQSSIGRMSFHCVAEARGIWEDNMCQLDAGLEQFNVVMMGGDTAGVKVVIVPGSLVLQPVCEPVITRVVIHPMDLQKPQELSGTVGYIVQSGDSSWEITKEFHTTMGNIIPTNELTDDQMRPGQRPLLVKEVVQGL